MHEQTFHQELCKIQCTSFFCGDQSFGELAGQVSANVFAQVAVKLALQLAARAASVSPHLDVAEENKKGENVFLK